ncbi:Rieske (2Fe-2S) protein (plasmid) [Rhizobium sp. CB3171]|uniref:Rieske (2Fe-2S) protein n=1 Tax=Rhizobium sp. CB3171 TaxID=3039157 RepID=UPI0024B0D526|nr:Rieske (2Fe-2S) protein [Rhizobium sp. CB3171]WFU05103.1 Rieske (2Fe-2S) protein [Rhizobium sp. CB3171]
MMSGATNRAFACRIEDVGPSSPKIVKVGQLSIGIFEIEDGYAAMLNVCPHRAGQLCEGPVCGTAKSTDRMEFVYDRAGQIIRCAWHGWEFDIKSGTCLVDEKLRARAFPVHVEEDEIYIELAR